MSSSRRPAPGSLTAVDGVPSQAGTNAGLLLDTPKVMAPADPRLARLLVHNKVVSHASDVGALIVTVRIVPEPVTAAVKAGRLWCAGASRSGAVRFPGLCRR